jgi:glycosyltransferase involved in cell wall biosynthesis
MANSDLIIQRHGKGGPRYLFIEPYLNGSHRALVQALMHGVPGRWTLLGLPGRFFRWRMRGGAAFLAEAACDLLRESWDGLLCSSMLNLAELRGLVPQLAKVPALVYFHENQLAYPAAGAADDEQRERDLFLAFSNLTSAFTAEAVVFNSSYHRDQVLTAADELMKNLPDAVPSGIVNDLAHKARVLPVPLMIAEAEGLEREERQGPLRLVWNHRWGQDKDPDSFFGALEMLAKQGVDFQVAVLGRKSGKPPAVFSRASQMLGKRLVQLGPVEDRWDYWRWLFWADVGVSTALQEYQGLAVAEAVWAGCRPLVPDALVYRELYSSEFRYQPDELTNHLTAMSTQPEMVRQGDHTAMVEQMTWPSLSAAWRNALEELCAP